MLITFATLRKRAATRWSYFFCTLATWLLVRNLQEPSSARWGFYAVASAMAVYSHFFGALVIVAHGVSLTFLPRNSLPLRDLKRSARWLAYMLFPIAIVVITVGAGSMRWIPAANLGSVLDFFTAISGNGGKLLVSMEAVAVCARYLPPEGGGVAAAAPCVDGGTLLLWRGFLFL